MAGNITIIVPKENFVKVPKGVVSLPEVDALALGIYVKVLLMGVDSSITIQGLADSLSVSLAKVQKAFAALQDAGYLRRTRIKDAAGRFIGWDYEISSEPLTDYPENRQSEKPTIGKTDCRKNGVSVDSSYNILNTGISIENNNSDNNHTVSNTSTTGIDNNNIPSSNTKRKEKKEIEERNEKNSGRFQRPSVQEVAAFVQSKGYDIDAEEFVSFYESKGWVVGKSPMKDWHQAVVTWAVRSRKDGRKATAKAKPLGDYYTDLIQEMKEFYGTDSPDEQ